MTVPAIATNAQIAQLSSPGCSRSGPAGDCLSTAARWIEATPLVLSVCWSEAWARGAAWANQWLWPERQRELHQHREDREPGAVPDIRPEPLHLKTPPHIAGASSPDPATL
ncbi:hypothetical protein ACVW1A_004386 [Bradyrhizobium sp. LB1.3]